MRIAISSFVTLCLLAPLAFAAKPLLPGDPLSDAQVAQFAKLAIESIPREFPNKLSHVMVGPDSVRAASGVFRLFRLALVGAWALDARAFGKATAHCANRR